MLGEAVLGAERLRDRLRDERGVAQRGEPDPEDAALYAGTSVDAASSASRVLPVPPGPVSVTRRAPSSIRESTSASSPSRPTKELAGRGRFVFEIVLSGGKRAVPELEDRDRLGDVLQPVLAEVGERELDELGGRRERTTWPPWAEAATRAAKWTSSPT